MNQTTGVTGSLSISARFRSSMTIWSTPLIGPTSCQTRESSVRPASAARGFGPSYERKGGIGRIDPVTSVILPITSHGGRPVLGENHYIAFRT